MTHYVLFRYAEGFFDDEKLAEMNEVFSHVCRDVEGAQSFVIEKNIVSRPNNMDIMVTMKLKDEKALGEYVRHPEHVEIAERYAPNITAMCSFDKED